MATATILVVDDEPAITELVGMALRYEGFASLTAVDGATALRLADQQRVDLVVLDIMLPDMSGLEICRRLRERSDVPVIFLTARDSLEDRLAGLTLGGDDYLPKPFSVEELVARIRAVLRRSNLDNGEDNAVIRVGDLRIDEDSREVSRAGQPVELTATEFNLLRYLAHNAGKVLSKNQILDHVWRYDFGGNHNVVEAYVSYLRRKIDVLGTPMIHTVRGVGYTLRPPRSGAS